MAKSGRLFGAIGGAVQGGKAGGIPGAIIGGLLGAAGAGNLMKSNQQTPIGTRMVTPAEQFNQEQGLNMDADDMANAEALWRNTSEL